MVHSSAMTQMTADLMENTLQAAVPCSVTCIRSFDKHMLWPPRYLEEFFLQITKRVLDQRRLFWHTK